MHFLDCASANAYASIEENYSLLVLRRVEVLMIF